MASKTDSNAVPVPHTGEVMSERKARHLEICTQADRYQVEGGSSFLNKVRLVHYALPELHADLIDSSVEFLGYKLSMPFFISSMTGGSDAGYAINKDLARLAQKHKLPVGMGSIRILFRKPEVLPHFLLKELAPDVPVFANLGAVQIRDMVHGQIIELLKRLEVDGLAIHLNPAQELFQPEGDRDFRGILDAIHRFCSICPLPVVVKETGCGLNPSEIQHLLSSGAHFVNIAGSGGTNWAMVESQRTDVEGQSAFADEEFRNWGNPTGLVLAALQHMEEHAKLHRVPTNNSVETPLGKPAPGQTFSSARIADKHRKAIKEHGRPSSEGVVGGRVLASGGIRSGMDFVHSIVLGARLAGTALPIIRLLSNEGFDAADGYIERMRTVLHKCMLLTNSATIAQLRTAPHYLEGSFKQEVQDYVRLFRGIP